MSTSHWSARWEASNIAIDQDCFFHTCRFHLHSHPAVGGGLDAAGLRKNLAKARKSVEDDVTVLSRLLPLSTDADVRRYPLPAAGDVRVANLPLNLGSIVSEQGELG